jgi:hypothetical protein
MLLVRFTGRRAVARTRPADIIHAKTEQILSDKSPAIASRTRRKHASFAIGRQSRRQTPETQAR